MSIVERGSFAIGPELAELGDHEDKAAYGGRFFSNKAPGLSFAAVPVYAAVRALIGPARRKNATPIFYLVRLLTVSALCLVALAVFARRLVRTAVESRWVPVILFGVAFGTPFLVYARSFFSHAWTASLLYLAFECLHRPVERRWHPVLAGFLAGWAVLSEYPAAILAALLLIDAAWRRPALRGAFFVVGALPAAALLGFYDAVCFAGPFDLSSSHEWYTPFSKLSSRKMFGFALPSAAVAFRFLFSPARGALFQSPFLLFLPAAVAGALRERAVRISVAAAGLLFLVMCAYENWHGGWALGARYLLPAALLVSWPLARLSERTSPLRRLLFSGAVVFSAILFLFSGSTFWFYPAAPVNAPRFFTAYWLAQSWLVPTLAGSSILGVVLLAGATAVAGGMALCRLLPARNHFVLAILTGVAAFALLFAGPAPRGTFDDRLTRIRILESFTDLDPDRQELLRLGSEAQTPSDRAAWTRTVRHYGLAGP